MIQKIKNYLPFILIALVIYSGWLTYKLIQEQSRADALQDSIDIYEEDLKAKEEKYLSMIDSIQNIKADREKNISHRQEKIEDILNRVNTILNQKNETPVDHMRDADSISQLFSRLYPDNS